MSKKMSRREFLARSVQLSAGIGAYATLGRLKLINSASAATGDYRALVCIFLSGGNDSYNMFVPNSTTEYQLYADARQNLAIEKNQILGVTAKNPDGATYGFHPAMPEIKNLFNGGRLAVMANVGALIEPTTRTSYKNNSVALPPRLFSHNDQQAFWHTLQSDIAKPSGWAGRVADLLGAVNTNQNLSMNISLAGNNIWQTGASSIPFNMSSNGVATLSGVNLNSGSFQESRRAEAFRALLNANHNHLFVDEYANIQKRAMANSEQVSTALNNFGELDTAFPDGNRLANSLKMAAKMIAIRDTLGLSRQIFYIVYGGWDTHSEQHNKHPNLLGDLSSAMSAFYTATEELGVANQVTSFTAADFGRTLTSNGDGSDHGWGSHQLVMGGAVNGQDMYGQMPEIIIDGPQDSGRGRIIPTTAVDQYCATLARWYGVSEPDIDNIFPNINNFTTRDLGFMI